MTLTRRPTWRRDWRKKNRRERFVRTSGVGGYFTVVLQRKEEEEEEMRRIQAEAEAEAVAEAERVRQEEEEQLVSPVNSVWYFISSLILGGSTRGG